MCVCVCENFHDAVFMLCFIVFLVGDWNTNVEHWWNDTDRQITKILGEEHVPLSLCPQHIQCGLLYDGT